MHDNGSTGTANESNSSFGLDHARLSETIARTVLKNRFCYTNTGEWMRYTGKVWEVVESTIAVEVVRDYVKNGLIKAADDWAKHPSPENKAIKATWTKLCDGSAISKIERLCRGIHCVNKRIEDFDTDPDGLNCQNGYLNLRTGELLPHSASQMTTKITGVPYIKDATHEVWDEALEAIPEQDVKDWFQLLYGQAITGHQEPDGALYLQHGDGANGKTSILNAVTRALGRYYEVASDKILLSNVHTEGELPVEFLGLKGARFAMVEELPKGRQLDVNRVKKLINTTSANVRPLYKTNPITFDLTHALFVNTNNIPRINDSDHGTWRRLVLVNFPIRYLDSEDEFTRDTDRLANPHIKGWTKTNPEIHKAALAWLVAGAQRWYESGEGSIALPKRVKDDTRAWQNSEDVIAGFLFDRMIPDPNSTIAARDLGDEMNAWLTATGHRTWNSGSITNRFAEHWAVRQHDIIYKAKVRKSNLTERRPSMIETDDPATALGPTIPVFIGMRFRLPKKDDGVVDCWEAGDDGMEGTNP